MLKPSFKTARRKFLLHQMQISEKREFHQNNVIAISSIFSKEREDHGIYRGLNLTVYILKKKERAIEKHVRTIRSVHEILFGFMRGLKSTNATFIMHQLQEKYLAKRSNLYLAFVDLENSYGIL